LLLCGMLLLHRRLYIVPALRGGHHHPRPNEQSCSA
jgi:hypothetical protein